eukprot:9066798-Pyramimonas_sp.AAC.1
MSTTAHGTNTTGRTSPYHLLWECSRPTRRPPPRVPLGGSQSAPGWARLLPGRRQSIARPLACK